MCPFSFHRRSISPFIKALIALAIAGAAATVIAVPVVLTRKAATTTISSVTVSSTTQTTATTTTETTSEFQYDWMHNEAFEFQRQQHAPVVIRRQHRGDATTFKSILTTAAHSVTCVLRTTQAAQLACAVAHLLSSL